jgi:xylulokinase
VSLQHTRADVLRAVLEGVALNTRWMLESVDEFLGQPARSITLVGGGGQSELWAQIFADTLGITVRLPHEPIQANVRGAAFLAGVGIGALSFEDIPARVPIQRVFEPQPANAPIYDARYAQFRTAHRRLSPIYRKSFKALRAAST